jgi:hypothetical protein
MCVWGTPPAPVFCPWRNGTLLGVRTRSETFEKNRAAEFCRRYPRKKSENRTHLRDVARPTKLNPEIQKQICDHLRSGLFRRAAAGLVGVDEQTLSRWYHRGASEARGLYREFHVAVNRAEAEFMQGATETLQAASTSNPKHVQWLLSRRFPELYGRRDNVEAKSPEDEAADTAALRDLLLDRLGKFLPDEPPAPEPTPAPAADLGATPEQAEDKGAPNA